VCVCVCVCVCACVCVCVRVCVRVCVFVNECNIYTYLFTYHTIFIAQQSRAHEERVYSRLPFRGATWIQSEQHRDLGRLGPADPQIISSYCIVRDSSIYCVCVYTCIHIHVCVHIYIWGVDSSKQSLRVVCK